MTAQGGENKCQGHLKISPHKDRVSKAKDNCGRGVRRYVSARIQGEGQQNVIFWAKKNQP